MISTRSCISSMQTERGKQHGVERKGSTLKSAERSGTQHGREKGRRQEAGCDRLGTEKRRKEEERGKRRRNELNTNLIRTRIIQRIRKFTRRL
jgi:hypothetical protein